MDTQPSPRGTARRLAVAAVVLLGAIWVAWLGFRPQVMGDYPKDYAPAMDALLGGHVSAFFAHMPTNGAGGSVLLRAPFSLLGKLLVGGHYAVFRFGALACELVTLAVGLVLAREMRRERRRALAVPTLVALFMLTPAVLDAILFGHPEEMLGASLCIGAVLLAAGGRSELAGAALGLAIINKPWGVLAIFPVLLAAPGRRLRLVTAAGAIVGVWTAAAYLESPAQFDRSVLGASTSIVAHPVDLWWPLARLHAAPGVIPAYFPPRLISEHARELAVLLSVPLALPLARCRRRPVESCLALLALLFLLRCALDPSNHVYYQVPFVLAFAAWEVRGRGMPVLSLLSLGGLWFVFHVVSGTGSLTAQYVCYVALATALAVILGRVVLGGQASIVQQSDHHRISRGVSRSVAA